MDPAEKWLQEHTQKCPIGRVTQEMCGCLRDRPRIKEAREYDLSRPLVCVGCQWWMYFPQSAERIAA